MRYLALYVGPGGPISKSFDADELELALEHVAEHGRAWLDAGADELDVDPDSPTLDEDLKAALSVDGWSLHWNPGHTDDYRLYVVGERRELWGDS